MTDLFNTPTPVTAKAVAPKVGAGRLDIGFRWRTRGAEFVAPADMDTNHLFYTLRMIWNNHVPVEAQVGRNVKLYDFGPHYTRAYFDDAITNLAAELFKRGDVAAWQRAELDKMAAYSAKPDRALPDARPASADRQYIACQFQPNAKRSYTYHNDGPPVAVGDRVAVTSFDGDGWQRVEVVAIVASKPSFPTKSILVDKGVE